MKKTREILEWPAELAAYSRVATALLYRKSNVYEGNPKIAPGYTTADGRIYIAHNHSLWEGKTEEEQITYRKGIVTHEILHQIYTNFEKEEFILKTIPSREHKIFSSLCNILEDPAIEHMAPLKIGGPMIKALNYAIYNTYKDSPKIDESDSPYGQYLSAMIQFGDLGILKGEFTFPEAEKMFIDTVELFYSGILEPNSGKRVDIAKELHNKTRPLWEPELEEAEKFAEMLKDLLDSFGKSEANGSGTGENPSDGEMEGLKGEDDKKSKRRKATIKKVSKEEFDKLKKNASKGGGNSSDGDVTIITCDDADADEDSGSGSGSSLDDFDIDKEIEENKKGASEGGEKSDKNSDKSEEDGENGGSNSKGSESDSSNCEPDEKPQKSSQQKPSADGKRQKPAEKAQKISGNSGTPSGTDGPDIIDEAEYNLTEDDLNYIRQESERIQKEYDRKTKVEDAEEAPIENIEIESKALKGLSCLNNNIKNDSYEATAEAYEKVLNKLGPDIRIAVSRIKKIFEQDYEDKEYRENGRIKPERVYGERVTSRLFEKRKLPTGKRDTCVAILVDESGSMCGSGKYVAARESCIALAEIFSKLDIPVYVMGFTADEQRHDIVHNHYIKWGNNARSRQSLLNISARSNNCDGYSIRYITKILRKRRETHKILFVLSDGQPAASAYGWGCDGVEDTTAAIREAKKYAHVLGVAIGNSDTETIQSMYQKNFLHISNVSELFYGLTKELKKMFKNI